jgi:hypothetical protein
MARNCAILGLGGSVADRDHIEELLALTICRIPNTSD